MSFRLADLTIFVNFVSMSRLQIVIATYGRRGIESIASLPHPAMDGVEYIVSWQTGGDDDTIPPALAARNDFRIFRSATRGLSINRNLGLSHATAPLVLLSDDDNDYRPEEISKVMEAAERHPDTDVFSFRYRSEVNPIEFLPEMADLGNPPSGYYPISFLLAFRREAIEKAGIRFNTRFGIGAEFPSGEEDLFLCDCLRAGLKGLYIPETVVGHEGTTTSMRDSRKDSFAMTKGAVHAYIHPHTWPLRMLTHSMREASGIRGRWRYCRLWIKGAHRHIRIMNGPQS